MRSNYHFLMINIFSIFNWVVFLINLEKVLQTWWRNCVDDYRISLRVTRKICKWNDFLQMINYLHFVFSISFSIFQYESYYSHMIWKLIFHSFLNIERLFSKIFSVLSCNLEMISFLMSSNLSLSKILSINGSF